MSETQPRTQWTWEQYLDWEARQPIRYELVDREIYAMGGGTAARDMISFNIRMALQRQVEGTGCRAHGSDLKIHTGTDTGRYPDVHVDCGKWAPGPLAASNPVLVVEVLSKRTENIDRSLKLRDYAATPSIRYYILLSQSKRMALVYGRDEHGHFDPKKAQPVQGLDAVIAMPELSLSLSLADAYHGIELEPDDPISRPRAV